MAAALREIAMIDYARGRAWYADEVMAGRANEFLAAVATGADFEMLLAGSPIGPLIAEATAFLERALAIFERLGRSDRASCRRSSRWRTRGTAR